MFFRIVFSVLPGSGQLLKCFHSFIYCLELCTCKSQEVISGRHEHIQWAQCKRFVGKAVIEKNEDLTLRLEGQFQISKV